MGRLIKPGISFYRMDAGHIQNKKVRLLYNEFGSDGYYIWHAIIDHGYLHNGYYFDMSDEDELELFASEYCKKKLTTIQEVIAGCIRRGLFDQSVSDLFGILTSDMMQETFLIATSERRAKGTIFEMRQDWLLIDFSQDVPTNIIIVPPITEIDPGKKRIIHRNNPQRRIDKKREDKNKQENTGAPAAPRSPGNENLKGERKKFIAPTLQEMETYFLQVIGDTKKPFHWPEDKCRNQAGHCWDHYQTNGWVQGRGKPIKDWQAACRTWIRNGIKGIFDKPALAEKEKPVVPRVEDPTPKLSRVQQEINCLYGLWLENNGHVTVISIQPEHYNFLKSHQLAVFSEDEAKEIRRQAKDYMTEKTLVGEIAETRLMKSFGVLEFFKQQHSLKKREIFDAS